MAQLTFPIRARELHVDARVNLCAPELAMILGTGRSAPLPSVGCAELDTGSNASGISSAVIQQLALVSHTNSSTRGVGGSVPVKLYRVSLSLFDATQPTLPWFVIPDVEVMELPQHVTVDVLIGMDVLLQCRLLLDGPGRQFTLDF
jgi:hypothetical protein